MEVIESLCVSQHDDLGLADHSLVWNSDLSDAIEFDNMMAQASVSLRSAAARTESRGAHAREDYPTRDDANWLKHTLAWMAENGKVSIDYRPVHLNTLSNEVEPIPPKARIY
jgi:succinate dehydrogenase / fumarate reductase flavoprotein subunit